MYVVSGRGGKAYVYPQWAYVIGWLIGVAPILLGMLFGAAHALYRADGTGIKVGDGGTEKRVREKF